MSLPSAQATVTVPLSSLNGSNGFRLDGASVYDLSGTALSEAGDVNGDGIDDLIVGAYGANVGDMTHAGSSYVVFGRSGGFSSSLDLGTLDGLNGFRLDGTEPGEDSGRAVSGGGDVNGDGIDDLLIGAYGGYRNGERTGSTYVVFGRSSGGFASAISLSTLDGISGFRLDGVAVGDRSGRAVSILGDVNGDGVDDLIVAALEADSNGSNSGSSYVVFGRSAGGFASAISLSTLDGSSGFRLDGAAPFDYSGRTVSDAGDINGDTVDDLIIGAPNAAPNGSRSGSSYVVFGRSSGGFSPIINLSSLDGISGFRLDGVAMNDNSGNALSAAGDVNGDGIEDLIIGAPGFNGAGPNPARSYVVFGRSAGGFASVMNLSTLDGSIGFRLDGSGSAVSGVGDINGDGVDDLVIGTPGAGFNGMAASGSSYVVFGRSTGGFASVINLLMLDNRAGFRLDGVATYDGSGRPVSSAGDINDDGINDLVIGARNARTNGVYSGSSYVVFGTDKLFSNGFE